MLFFFFFFTSILHLFPLVFALTFVSVAYFFFSCSLSSFPSILHSFFFFQCSISAIKPDALELNVLVYFFLVLSNVRHHCCLPRSLFFPLSDLGACLCVTHVYRLTSLLLSFLKLRLLSEKKKKNEKRPQKQ